MKVAIKYQTISRVANCSPSHSVRVVADQKIQKNQKNNLEVRKVQALLSSEQVLIVQKSRIVSTAH